MKIPINIIKLTMISLLLLSCSQEAKTPSEFEAKKYYTENVIVIVMDGARFSETFGDSSHRYIPHLANDIAPNGVTYMNFYNEGITKTVPGHVAICTSFYDTMSNDGTEIPSHPSIFQYYNKTYEISHNKSWIIASKDKLEVLGNCSDSLWENRFIPKTDCGNSGLESGYRNDSVTIANVLTILKTETPNLLLVNLKEPDASGHQGDWTTYVSKIKESDAFIYSIWNFIESDSRYKNKTTLFITNDHGRHLDSVEDGFVSHGDSCQGCKHIMLMAVGPDFPKDTTIYQKRELIDIAPTIGKLLEFDMSSSYGSIMSELFTE